jgi:hypothetical protein
LVAAGRRTTPTVRRAVRFLRHAQHADGGYSLSSGAPTNAQSTAFAALGLTAAHVDPASVRRHGHSPLDYLRALQTNDGSVRYSRTSHQTPVWVTAQALLAFDKKPLPVLAPSAPAAGTRTIDNRSAAQARTAGSLLALFLGSLLSD